MLRALVYAYVLGGLTFIPLVIIGFICITIYTSIPVGDFDVQKPAKDALQEKKVDEDKPPPYTDTLPVDAKDQPKHRKAWLTVRRTFEEQPFDGNYVSLMKSFIDARSKDPKRSRPRDTWYAVLNGHVLYLYEDEAMTECGATINMGEHDVVIYPEGLPDGELYSKRNAICLRAKEGSQLPSLTREMKMSQEDIERVAEERSGGNAKKKQKEKEKLLEQERKREAAREEAHDAGTPWFLFVRSNVEMEDWYFALIHAADHPSGTPNLKPLEPVFSPADMDNLVSTIDEQPDVIPMRWLNALLGRLFYSYYNTDALESYVIGRLMKKLAKVKRPQFLGEVVVTEVSMGNTPVTLSKPMLKELTKEGDASFEMHLQYQGEMRITVQTVANIPLGARFKPYSVKLTLAAVLREIEGNIVVRVKRPPSSRIWYAFTQMPRMVLNVGPVVSDRQITWNMILHSIESRLKEIILESIVLPNMDDISFFDSAAFAHRGGIFADASRKARSTDADAPALQSDAGGSSSNPPSDDHTVDVLGEPVEIHRSHTTGEMQETLGPEPSSPRVRPRYNTLLDPNSAADPAETPSHPKWLHHHHKHNSLSKLADLESHTQDSTSSPGLQATEHSPPQSGLIPHSPSSDSISSKKKRKFLGVRKGSHSPSPSPTSRSPHDDSLMTPTDTVDSRSTISSKSSKSTQSSLFATIKSKATSKTSPSKGKWTINWGGMTKRDSSPHGSASAEETADGEARRASYESPSQKVKTSYADMRAAVKERRERSDAERGREAEREETPEAQKRHDSTREPSPAPSLPRAESPTELASTDLPPTALPIRSASESTAIPDRGLERALESTSPDPTSSLGIATHVDRGRADPVLSSSPPGRSGFSPRPTSGSPASINRTEVPSTIIIPPTPDVPHGSPAPVPAPVRTQPPQARTMIIPGIHASHKGEVQSMGYVAPLPQRPVTPEKPSSSGLQSMYRLWKPAGAPGSATEDGDRSGSPNAGTQALPDVPDAPKLQAPPLPPRNQRSPSLFDASSLASAALKFIASKDEQQRTSQSRPTSSSDEPEVKEANHSEQVNETASTSPSPAPSSPKPPLPPRRPQQVSA